MSVRRRSLRVGLFLSGLGMTISSFRRCKDPSRWRPIAPPSWPSITKSMTQRVFRASKRKIGDGACRFLASARDCRRRRGIEALSQGCTPPEDRDLPADNRVRPSAEGDGWTEDRDLPTDNPVRPAAEDDGWTEDRDLPADNPVRPSAEGDGWT